MFLAVFLATVVGIMAIAVLGKTSRSVFLAGHRTAGRLIESVRWPLWGTTVFVAIGIFQRIPAGFLLWLAPLFLGAGIAGRYAYVLAKATRRTIRILRARRNPASP